MEFRHFLQLLLTAAIWGASHVLMRIAVPQIGSEFSVLFRILFGVVALMIFLMPRGVRLQRHHFKTYLWVGFLNMALPFFLFSRATKHLPAPYLVIINALVPIFSGIASAILIREAFGIKRVISVIFGIIGVVLLKEFGSIPEMTPEVTRAFLMAILASASYGVGTLIVKMKAHGVPPEELVWGAHSAAGVIYLPIALGLSLLGMAPSLAELGQAPLRVWLSVMGLGVFASGLAFLVFYRLVSEIGAFMASLSTYIMPLFGLFWGMLLLDERATPGMLLGGVLVLASAGLFVTKPKKSAK